MVSKKILSNLDLDGNQLENVVVEVLESAPSNPKSGQIYYDSTKSKVGYYNGSSWKYVTEYTFDTTPTANSTNPVTSGGIKTAISTAETNAKNLANATGTLAISKGGTGATTATAAEYNIIGGVETVDTAFGDDRYVAVRNQTVSNSNGSFRWFKVSNLWTYIKGKITGAISGLITSNLTASKALVSNSSGKIAASSVSSTELGYLSGVTSSIQDQLDSKQSNLTFDTTPTEDSTNPVTSDGIKTALDAKQDTITAGTGLSKSGTTINHSNSITARTSDLGSTTAIPKLRFDAQGHITTYGSATVYPPTSAGTSGQVWQSKGSGVGQWCTLDTTPTANSTKPITSGAVKTALTEMDGKISAIPKFAISVVTELPATGDPATVYLVKTSETETGNLYTEYIYVNNAWEKLGTQTLDLSGYATTEAMNTALSGKVDKVSGKGLSTNDFTAAYKTKLDGIATGAEVNQNAFSNITVGSTTIAADAKTDTLTLTAGSNVTLTPDATNDKITIAATDTKYSTVSKTAAGLCPQLPNETTTTKYLRQDSSWQVPPDTKNTSGSTDTSSKIFLIGATSQAANPQTYSHDTAYVGTDGCLYSGGTKVLTAHQDISGKVNKSGDTMTGRLTTTKAINQIITGSGTAASDKGSGVSPRYFPAKWTFNTGSNATDGDIYTIKIPVAGHDYGVFMSVNNGTNYYPVILDGTSRFTTHFGNGTYISVIFEATASAASMYELDGSDARVTVTGGCFRLINYRDYDTDVRPSAYCETAAGTAAKAASCTNYALLSNSYLHVLMRYSNTSKTALTLNVNGKGAKPIYINGSASSASNYSLPAGTYLVYYNGTNYYFRTDGKITGSITGSSDGSSSSVRSRGNVTAESGTTVPSLAGISMQQAYNNSYPTNYGNVLTLKGTGSGQLLLGWSGTSGARANTYVRSKRDTSDANWSDWYVVMDSGNIGSYAADRTAITNITRSGTTFTATRADNTTFTFTQQDNNTTYDVVSKTAAGLCPTLPNETTTTKYLRQDGTWVVPPNTTYSTATQSANGLMSAADKKKLDGVATGAEVNQNAFSNFKVSDTTIAADTKTDTLTLVAGSNVTLTPDATNDQITISSTNTTYSNATQSAAGLMSAADKIKLDEIAEGAQVNTVTGVKGGSETDYRTGNVNITKSNVGLGNVADALQVYDKAGINNVNMNTVAGYRNAMGMASLTGTDTTVNPNGQTSWHHFINMSYKETSGSNMWQTQIANKAGTTDLWVRSRSGGAIADGTAWAAPWTRILTGSNWNNVVTKSALGIGNVTNYDQSKAIKSITRSGTTFTYTCLDNTTGTFTQQDNNTTYSANNGVGLSGTTFYNSGVRSIATGSTNGTISVNTNGTSADVAVKGLGSAAYTASTDYATVKSLTNENLNNVTTPGFYNAGGGNSVTNKPSGIDYFGLEVIHNASGSYYTQIINNGGGFYRRYCNNGTWSSWTQDKYTDTTYSTVSKTSSGLCPALPNETTTTKYLRQDGTWVAPPNTTYSVVSKTAAGLCPTLPNETTTTKYLRQDGTWVVPPNDNTKNTAGSTDTSSKIFIIGATSQAANPQTYSHDTAYVGTDGCLYSGGSKVLTAHQDISGKVNKSGDTMSGNLTISKSSPKIQFTNTDSVAVGTDVPVISVSYKNSNGDVTVSTNPISVIGTDSTDGYNTPVRLGSTNGTTIVGAGESSTTFAGKQSKYNDEILYLVSDNDILLYKNMSNDGSLGVGPYKAAGFSATPTSGQVVITDGTNGGMKSSGYTIAKSVPSNAVFTDTTYSAGAGLALSGTTFRVSIPRVGSQDSKTEPGLNTVKFEEYGNTAPNTPSAHWYNMITMQGGDANYCTQLALGMTTTGAYYRVKNANTWSAWQSLINTNTTYSAGAGLALSGTTFKLRSCYAMDNTTNAASKPWHKFASITLNSGAADMFISFIVYESITGANRGILQFRCRVNSSASDNESATLAWLVKWGLDPSKFVWRYVKNSGSITYELWCSITQWHTTTFVVQDEGIGAGGDISTVFTLYDTNAGAASYTAGAGGGTSVLSGEVLRVNGHTVEKDVPSNAVFTDTNTWRGIQDNLTSSTNTTESLSAKQGYLLANGSARDNSKLPLTGGTIASDSFAPLIIRRNHTSNYAGIRFDHYSSGTTVETLGYLAINTRDGSFSRVLGSNTSTVYTILDSANSSVSLSGSTLTVKINGVEKSLTNTNTTYSTVSKTAAGLCPVLPNETTTTKYLRQDGSWVVPPNTTYSTVSKTDAGLCPALPNETTTTKYLRQDGTWTVPPNTTYSVTSKTAAGLCPQLPNETTTTKYLRQDGTWVVPPNDNTKNTAGSTDTSSKIFLIGATSQAANPQTYSHDTAYVGTDGCLYSGGTKVLTAHQDISGKVSKSGDTMTGRLTTAKPINQIITGSGTAGSDKGSGVSPRYFPAKWTFNTGVTATNGDIFTIKLPVAGHDYGVFMSVDNGTKYYPVVLNGTGRLTGHYPNGTYIQVIFESSASAASMFPLNGGDARETITGGAFRVLNYYDTNTDIRPSAYCETAADTAAKAASCTQYSLLSKSYLHVLMRYSNTSKTALTFNVNGKGAKPIYINGSASSTSNYTLPAGTYLVYYNGTNYYFRTDGKITGDITGNAATVNGLTVQTAVPANAKFTDTTYSTVSKTAAGLCPQLPNESTTTKYLRQDGTWVAPTGTTYSVVSKTANGLCPQLPNETTTTKYLRQDGTWVVPPNDNSTTHLYAGSGTAANAATTNGNTKITVTDNSTVRNSITIKGTGATTVVSDANGVITVNSTDTTYSEATQSAAGLMSANDKTNLTKVITGITDSGSEPSVYSWQAVKVGYVATVSGTGQSNSSVTLPDAYKPLFTVYGRNLESIDNTGKLTFRGTNFTITYVTAS